MTVNDLLVIMMFLTFGALLFTGFPIAFILGGVSVLFTFVGYYSDLYLGTVTGLSFTVVGMVANRIYKLMDNWVLVAVPMFIFMGVMLERSGVAEKMMRAMQDLFGKVRGGLAVTVAVVGVILASATGIIGAKMRVQNRYAQAWFGRPEGISVPRGGSGHAVLRGGSRWCGRGNRRK